VSAEPCLSSPGTSGPSEGLSEVRLQNIVAKLAAEAPDVVLLQEVALGPLPDLLRDALTGIGLGYFVFSGDPSSAEKRYGNVIASRWPVALTPVGWASGAPWPQLLASATVESPFGAVDFFAAHIPNGSANGWRKIYTFEALAGGLGGAPERPRVVGGDFNEPKYVRATGEIVPFGGVEKPNQPVRWDGTRCHPKCKNTHPRARWRDGVLSVLNTDAKHGLRHAWLDRHGYVEMTTFSTRKSARFFDHILVSKHFAIIDAGYHLDWNISTLSDHAAAWARVELR
jgi:endonuclease/exonuclease/phosphatase family metal-dependent hydrolase